MGRAVSEIIDDVMITTGLESVDNVFASTDEMAREVAVAVNDTADEIVEAHDWAALTKVFTMIGDGQVETFGLPEEFIRMPKAARVWSNRVSGNFQQIVDADTWVGLETRFDGLIFNSYILTDDQITIRPAPAAGERVRLTYVSSSFAKNGSTLKSRFTDPSDQWVLDYRLLRLGLAYNLRMEQGLDANHEFRKYQSALEKAISRDKGPRVLKQASGASFDDAEIAYPWTVQTS